MGNMGLCCCYSPPELRLGGQHNIPVSSQGDADPAATPASGAAALATQEQICLGGGCFWCIEAVYRRCQGVIRAESGYMGGHVKNPTYKQVCQADTGHVEVVNVVFNNSEVSLAEILEIFWAIHDPCQEGGQGNDIGAQYRSAIFCYDDSQRSVIMQSKQDLIRKKPDYEGRIVTEVTKVSAFFKAEGYHDDYYTKNPNQGYCRVVIAPKLKKAQQHAKIQG